MMNPARSGLQTALRTVIGDGVASGAGKVNSSRLYTPRQGTVQIQKRQYYVVSQKTTFDKKGGVQDPGHIQLRTKPEEQEKYGVRPTYGHFRDKTQPKSRDHPVEGKLHAKLANGQEFSVKGFVAPALKASDDPERTRNVDVIDMGDLTLEEAERLNQFTDRHVFPDYEVSGDLGMNCVHGLKLILETVHQISLDLHKHEMPQDAATKLHEQITRARQHGGADDKTTL